MRKVREVIVVEGRYDKNTIKQVVDCTVIETSGFGIFKDKEKVALLRTLAQQRGIIVLTDSDGAGFVIRNHLKGIIKTGNVKHCYIPDILGKEKRKRAPSKEGKLGVEGMTRDVIISALERAGATFDDEGSQSNNQEPITKSDFFLLGLTGTDGSSENRRLILNHLSLPSRLTTNGLLEILNIMYSRDEFLAMFEEIFPQYKLNQ